MKAYSFKGEPGKAYRFELTTTNYSSSLQLQDANNKMLRQAGGGFGSIARLAYKAVKPGVFRLLVSSGQPAVGGPFTLTITEAPAKETKLETIQLAAGKPAVINSSLTEEDETNAQNKLHKDYAFVAEAGKTYRIDLHSKAFDAYLYLQDADHKTLSQNDDNGESLDSRIIYKITKAGTYHIIATSLGGKGTGPFRLTVAEAGKVDMMQLRIEEIYRSSREQQKPSRGTGPISTRQKGDLGPRDAMLALRTAGSLGYGDPQVAKETYSLLGKALAGAKSQDVANQGKRLLGQARRLGLLGQEMTVMGTTVDGRSFDLAKLKGKVVLVDFWATWCGPCVTEIPNVKRLYEKYHKAGFEVIGISLDDSKEPCEPDFIKNQKLPWPSIYDKANGTDQELAVTYGANTIPLAILVGPDGRVVFLNARAGDELERLLRGLVWKARSKSKDNSG